MKKGLPLLLIIPAMLSSCAKEISEVQKGVFACDTWFSIKAQNVNEKELTPVFDIVLNYSKLFDGFYALKGINNIKTINETNDEVAIPVELYDALLLADEYYEKTEGYFNPYLGELTYAYKESFKEEKLPAQSVIDNALNNLKTFDLKFNETNHSVQRIGDSLIDLGGFAKGYILDKTKEYCVQNNIDNYFISGGSSSNYFTTKYNGDAYNVGLKYLKNSYLQVKNSSIGISSVFEQNIVIDNERYSHIINPFNGKSTSKWDFSVVEDESATLTDVFSTVLMLLETEEEINKFKDKFEFSYMIFKDENCVIKTEDMELLTY